MQKFSLALKYSCDLCIHWGPDTQVYNFIWQFTTGKKFWLAAIGWFISPKNMLLLLLFRAHNIEEDSTVVNTIHFLGPTAFRLVLYLKQNH